MAPAKSLSSNEGGCQLLYEEELFLVNLVVVVETGALQIPQDNVYKGEKQQLYSVEIS